MREATGYIYIEIDYNLNSSALQRNLARLSIFYLLYNHVDSYKKSNFEHFFNNYLKVFSPLSYLLG